MPASNPITVLVVNPRVAIRHHLRQQMAQTDEIKMVGEADCGEAALELCDFLNPDVVLMDVVMPGLDGMTITQILRSRFPATRVLIVSSTDDGALIPIALRAGATGYLHHDVNTDELIQAIRAAASGLSALSAEALEWLIHAPVSTGTRAHTSSPDTGNAASVHALDLYFSLTHRERQVLNLVLSGYTSAEIGGMLYISPRTAEKHRANMMNKLEVRNQYELARLAYHIGVMPVGDEDVTHHPQPSVSVDWRSDLTRERQPQDEPAAPVRLRA